jgi:hypothetical protein
VTAALLRKQAKALAMLMRQYGGTWMAPTYDSNQVAALVDELVAQIDCRQLTGGFLELETGTAYITETELVITGQPAPDDERHNCDALGCSSVSHVIFRQRLAAAPPNPAEVPS